MVHDQRRKPRLKWVAIIICAVLGPLLCVGAALGADRYCECDIKALPVAPVDMSPLMNLEWTRDLVWITDTLDVSVVGDLSVDSMRMSGRLQCDEVFQDQLRGSSVWLRVETSTVEAARRSFERWLGFWGEDAFNGQLSDYTFGQNGDSQYAVSYVRRTKSPPEGLCLPTHDYESWVLFQKRNVVITIQEFAPDKNGHCKDEVIKWLAEQLREK